uniref:Uncharacterized protein n=1 Tax=Anguilla anguilla TaxID=7936 RepID=A0A0E9VEM6_ANGAN
MNWYLLMQTFQLHQLADVGPVKYVLTVCGFLNFWKPY